MYNVYLLVNDKCNNTYVGITNNLERRIRQHNGEIKGGANNNKTNIKMALDGIIVLAIRYKVHKYREKNKVAGKLKAIGLSKPRKSMNGTASKPPVRPKYRA